MVRVTTILLGVLWLMGVFEVRSSAVDRPTSSGAPSFQDRHERQASGRQRFRASANARAGCLLGMGLLICKHGTDTPRRRTFIGRSEIFRGSKAFIWR
jgi:hypothetical protein